MLGFSQGFRFRVWEFPVGSAFCSSGGVCVLGDYNAFSWESVAVISFSMPVSRRTRHPAKAYSEACGTLQEYHQESKSDKPRS